MKNTEYFKDKKITIIGLARSGLACANLLYDLGARVSVSDIRRNEDTVANSSRLRSGRIRVELGRHTQEFIRGSELLVVSPGVSGQSDPIAWAEQLNIPVISEIEVGFLLCPAVIIAVTGSSGKRTFTSLIGKIIDAKQKRAVV